MNVKWTAVAIVLVLVLGGGAFLLLNSNSSSSTTPTPTQASSPTTEPTAMESDKAKKSVTVTLTSSGFSPATITIDKGTTVIWKNESGMRGNVSSDPHPVHTNFPELNLGNFNDGETLEHTFEKTGTFGIHDHLNPSFTAKVIVK